MAVVCAVSEVGRAMRGRSSSGVKAKRGGPVLWEEPSYFPGPCIEIRGLEVS